MEAILELFTKKQVIPTHVEGNELPGGKEKRYANIRRKARPVMIAHHSPILEDLRK